MQIPIPETIKESMDKPLDEQEYPRNQQMPDAWRQVLNNAGASLFLVERRNGQFHIGDAESHYARCTDFEHLTFDITNNRALANVGIQGAIKALTIYRDSYRAACDPSGGWPGVWMAKDNSSYGPYAYSLSLGDEPTVDLSGVEWDFRTDLLDNIFPRTTLYEPQGRCIVHLLSYCPLSEDGGIRLGGMVYLLALTNTTGAPLTGTVHLPRLFASGRQQGNLPWALFDPYDFEIGLADSATFQPDIPFSLTAGESVVVPTILYMPGEPTIAAVNERGALHWFTETHRYFRRVLGRWETPDHPFVGLFHERQILQTLQSVALSASGKMAGSNWGSYPATRQIWCKDTFYSCLPFPQSDPLLARKMILWFTEFGVRQVGQVVPGGINHSISLSVASIVLADLYYSNTGDGDFFREQPSLINEWRRVLDALLASRLNPAISLFPTTYISDGWLDCDYHTGSNVCVWRALVGLSRILHEVFHDTEAATHYDQVGAEVHKALLERTVIDGPFGPQFLEGTFADGRAPLMISDGEESDTTLMPFYGFLPREDNRYCNYMRFSVSPENKIYQPKTRTITWAMSPLSPLEKRVTCTTPGLNKGLSAQTDLQDFFGDTGAYTELRRLTDADGSIWWWPYPDNATYGNVIRGVPGKSAWTAGVHFGVLMANFLGMRYDAPTRTLWFAPLVPGIGSFSATEIPMGFARFSLSMEWNQEAGKITSITLTNRNAEPVTWKIQLPGYEQEHRVLAHETVTI